MTPLREPPPRFVVVGGGITGLSAAHRLVEIAREEGREIEIVLLETGERLGGNLRTVREGPYLLEAGPDTIVTHKPAGLALVRRLGLESDLVPIAPRSGATEVVHRGRRVPIPDGFFLISPTRVGPVLRSPLLSPAAKLRLVLEPFVPPLPEGVEDESLASFVTRRLGPEVFERIAEPIAAGLYMARAEKLSLRATMPRFLDLERAHGSLLRGMRAALASRRGPAPPPFVAFRDGIERLVEGIAARLPEGSVRLRAAVRSLRPSLGRWRVGLEGGGEIVADAVLLAAPAWASARILKGVDPEAAAALDALEHASCATVHLAYRAEDVPGPPTSLGFFVPRGEGGAVVACSHVSVKFDGRGPDGEILFRAFLGGAVRAGGLRGDDAALVARTHEALLPLLGLRGGPCFTRVFRFERLMPQFAPGDAGRVAALRGRLAAHPGLHVAGSAVGAFGIPDCVASGEGAAVDAAKEIAARPRAEIEAAG